MIYKLKVLIVLQNFIIFLIFSLTFLLLYDSIPPAKKVSSGSFYHNIYFLFEFLDYYIFLCRVKAILTVFTSKEQYYHWAISNLFDRQIFLLLLKNFSFILPSSSNNILKYFLFMILGYFVFSFLTHHYLIYKSLQFDSTRSN